MLTIEDINPKLLAADYAMRGRLVNRAQELEKQGKKIIYCNIGNPHNFQQKPLTYIREILSLLEYPHLLNQEIDHLYHKDSIIRAKYILKQLPEGLGAYSASAGISFIREAIAEFIEQRDNINSNPEQIILTDGASAAAQIVLTALVKNDKDGIMLPIPQYPMYSAALTLRGGKFIGYYLDEENNWQLNHEILCQSYNQAKSKGINPVAITAINPGNPTGAVLSYKNIKMIINFAKKYNLAVLADEVYQENIYSKAACFYSFAKATSEMEVDDVSLFSINSISKGYLGECGHRSGYLEIRNVPKQVFSEFVKLQSINLCANITGQMITYLMAAPPKPGDDSYELFIHEKTSILNNLKEKAHLLGNALNKIEGINANIPDGAMYAFVKINLPEHRMTTNGVHPDEAYCIKLLEETGICVVPGSGFGQLPNTLHFRTTFLPPKEVILDMVTQLKQFHYKYTQI